MSNFYGLLTQFSQGTTPCRRHLERHYDPKLVDEAIEHGFIREIGKNEDGDALYMITELGRNIRDN